MIIYTTNTLFKITTLVASWRFPRNTSTIPYEGEGTGEIALKFRWKLFLPHETHLDAVPQGLGTHKKHHKTILDWDTGCVQKNHRINISQTLKRQLHSKFDQNANVNSQATKTYSKNYKFEFSSTPSFPRSFISRPIFFPPPFRQTKPT